MWVALLPARLFCLTPHPPFDPRPETMFIDRTSSRDPLAQTALSGPARAGLQQLLHAGLFLLLVAPGLSAAPAEGHPLDHDLSLVVRDATRPERAVVQARVTLALEGTRIAGHPPVLTRLSGADGRVVFSGLDAGEYRLSVEAVGFETSTNLFRIPAASVVEIALTPRPLTLGEVMATANPLRSGAVYTAAQTFDRESLNRRFDASIGTMLNGEPGVAMRSLGPAPTRPVIRGFDGDRILVLENGERMGDIGERSSDHAVALDPLAAERIEIVRGPASLLYGSGALGGVVNMSTRDLPRSWSRGLQGVTLLQGASVNQAASGAVALTYGEHAWASTLRFSVRETDDIRTPEGRIGDTALSSRDGALGFVRAWDALQFGVGGSFVDRRFGIPEAWDDPEEEVFLTMDQQALQARLDWEPASPGFIRAVEVRTRVSRFFQQEIERAIEEDGSFEDEIGLEYDARTFSGTATLRHGTLGLLGEGAVGFAARSRQMDVGGDEAFFPGVDERSVALFTFQEAPLTRDLLLQFGARVEWNQAEARPGERFPGVNGKRRGTALSGSVGLNWRPSAAWEAGTQLARAHRVPLAEELFANGSHLAAGVFEIGSSTLSDEVSLGVDLFVRRVFARGSAEVAAFTNWIGDYIVFQPLGRKDEGSGFPVFKYQGSDARMLGGEVSADLRLNDTWSAGLGLDWVRGTRTGETTDPLPTMPPLRGRLQLEADPGPWWVGSTIRAVASQDRVAPEEMATHGYVLADIQAGLRVGADWRGALILRLDNALDTGYRDHLSRLPERDLLMPGRNLSLLLRWAF
jgi:iron complex outermembrane recepter protein